MSDSIIIILSSIIIVIAFVVAHNARNNGYPFWRTFIMALIGLNGVTLLFLKLIG